MNGLLNRIRQYMANHRAHPVVECPLFIIGDIMMLFMLSIMVDFLFTKSPLLWSMLNAGMFSISLPSLMLVATIMGTLSVVGLTLMVVNYFVTRMHMRKKAVGAYTLGVVPPSAEMAKMIVEVEVDTIADAVQDPSLQHALQRITEILVRSKNQGCKDMTIFLEGNKIGNMTLFQWACRVENIDILQFILQKIKIDAKRIAFLKIQSIDNKDVFKWACDNHCFSVLLTCLAELPSTKESMQWLQSSNVLAWVLENSCYWTSETQHIECILTILDKIPETELVAFINTQHFTKSLPHWSSRREVTLIEWVCERRCVSKNGHHYIPIIERILNKIPSTVLVGFLDAPRSYSFLKDNTTQNIIQWAIECNQVKLIKIILKKRPDLQKTQFQSLLVWARREKHDDVIKMIIEQQPALEALEATRGNLVAFYNHLSLIGANHGITVKIPDFLASNDGSGWVMVGL